MMLAGLLTQVMLQDDCRRKWTCLNEDIVTQSTILTGEENSIQSRKKWWQPVSESRSCQRASSPLLAQLLPLFKYLCPIQNIYPNFKIFTPLPKYLPLVPNIFITISDLLVISPPWLGVWGQVPRTCCAQSCSCSPGS